MTIEQLKTKMEALPNDGEVRVMLYRGEKMPCMVDVISFNVMHDPETRKVLVVLSVSTDKLHEALR